MIKPVYNMYKLTRRFYSKTAIYDTNLSIIIRDKLHTNSYSICPLSRMALKTYIVKTENSVTHLMYWLMSRLINSRYLSNCRA